MTVATPYRKMTIELTIEGVYQPRSARSGEVENLIENRHKAGF